MNSTKPGSNMPPRTRALGLVVKASDEDLQALLNELRARAGIRVIFARISNLKLIVTETAFGIEPGRAIVPEPASDQDLEDEDSDKDERQGAWSNRGRQR